MKNSRFLIVAPHHDDEILGCGGTAAKMVQNGCTGAVVFVTAGWSGLPSVPRKKQAISLREDEARNACSVIGIKTLFFLHREDRNFSVDGSLIHSLVKTLREFRPNIVFIPHTEESDYEHQLSATAAREAIWLSRTDYMPNAGKSLSGLRAVYSYEVWTPLREYQLKEDITKYINRKKKAMQQYKSQFGCGLLMDAIEGLNLYRGSMTSDERRYCEVFQVRYY